MRKIFLLLILTGFCVSGFAQKSLNLQQAVDLALQRNTQLQKSTEALKSYESGLKASFGGLLPSLSANAGWSWSRSEEIGGQYNFGGSVITLPPSSTDSRNFSAGLSSNWTLFDGLSNFSNLSKNKSSFSAAKYSIDRLKQEIIYQTVSFYFDVLNAGKLLKLKEDDLKWNQKNYEIIFERNKLGAGTLADVYAQQVKLGSAELELIRAQNSLETLKSGMLYYLGLDVLDDYSFDDSEYENTEIDPKKDDFVIDSNLSELVKTALKSRADYQSSLLLLSGAKDNVSMAKAGHLPTLNNYASFGFRSNRLENLTDSKNYQVGLSLGIPIFSGWNVDYRIQLAQVDVKSKEIELDDLERLIKKDLQKNYLDLSASEKRIDVSKKSVIAAAENRKIEEEKYSLGSSILLNVLIANAEYTNALSGYINAQFEYLKLKKQAEYLLGTLRQ